MKFSLTGKRILALISCLVLVAAFWMPQVKALAQIESHEHAYAENRCTCGAANFEAEDGLVTGTNTDTSGTEGFVLERVSSNNRPTSGGKCVGNWSAAGNRITWKFSLNKEVAAADMRLWIAPGGDASGTDSALELSVNGVKAVWKTLFTPARGEEGGWYQWTDLVTENTAFQEGNNIVVLKNLNGFGTNADNLEIGFSADVVISAYEEITHKAARFEAESGLVTGTPSEGNDSLIVGGKESCSGGACVGNWGEGDNLIKWEINADKACDKNVKLSVALVPIGGEYAPGDAMLLRVNGVNVSWQDSVMPSFDGESWYTFFPVTTDFVSLTEGKNIIELEANGGYPMNIDYIEVNAPVDVEITKFAPRADFKIEAESGSITGTPTFDNPDFIVTGKESASGGACVGNWGNGDNLIRWTINSDKACLDAALSVAVVAIGGETAPSEAMILRINGQKVSFKDASMPAFDGESWYDFKIVKTMPAALIQGDNTVELEANNEYSMNIDYISFNVPEGTQLTLKEEPVPPQPDHTHTFTEGRCACGAALFEAESADLRGTPSDENAGFVLERTSSNERPTSGGKCVGNWAVAGNKIIWRFSLDKEYLAVPVTLWIAPSGTAQPINSSIRLSINGAAAAWTTSNLPAYGNDDKWYNWQSVTTAGLTFASGNIEVVLENIGAVGLNVDCIDIGFAKDTVIGDYVGEPPIEHKHDFANGRCSCGAAKLEAENGTATGTPTYDNAGFVETNQAASGNAYIGNWGDGDNMLAFSVELSQECKEISIGICFSPTAADVRVLPTSGTVDDKGSDLWAFEMRVNGVMATWTTRTLPQFNNDYYAFTTVWTNALDLKAGKNLIEIEAWDYYAMNIDYIVLAVPSACEVTMNTVDNVPPVISQITVTTLEPEAGKPVSFEFTATDHISSASDLVVSVKVYLNYGKDNQTEINCENNTFTPAEAGKYTIVVTATDKAENNAEKTRAIVVAESTGGGSENPDPDVKDPEKGAPLALILSLSIGGGLVLVGGAVAAVLFIRKKRNSRGTL